MIKQVISQRYKGVNIQVSRNKTDSNNNDIKFLPTNDQHSLNEISIASMEHKHDFFFVTFHQDSITQLYTTCLCAQIKLSQA